VRALGRRFPGHDGIHRPDVSWLPINPVRMAPPVGRPLRRHNRRTPLAFRRAGIYHRTAGSVLAVCVSRGDKPGSRQFAINKRAP
jgi:hypothetical protein